MLDFTWNYVEEELRNTGVQNFQGSFHSTLLSSAAAVGQRIFYRVCVRRSSPYRDTSADMYRFKRGRRYHDLIAAINRGGRHQRSQACKYETHTSKQVLPFDTKKQDGSRRDY